jgi:hypothetical protein
MSLKNSQSSTQSTLESFKMELRSRDDTIQKLRDEILMLEEKRDINLAEVI